jgi:hypothetical protein
MTHLYINSGIYFICRTSVHGLRNAHICIEYRMFIERTLLVLNRIHRAGVLVL